jgi:hypothetical protein
MLVVLPAWRLASAGKLGIIIETASADSAQDSSIALAVRSAMIAGPWPVFINSSTSREANAAGTMVNL